MHRITPCLFFSHRLDILVDRLVEQFEAHPIDLFQTRTILVPNGYMKQWLLLEIAKRKGIAMGLKVVTVEQFQKISPNSLELFCLIYQALLKNEAPELREYLEGKTKRLLDLTGQLVSLFFTYGQYGEPLFDPHAKAIDWQHAILQKLFVNGPWRMPVQILPKLESGPVICFAIDFLPPLFWEFLFRSPSLSIYLFSPCVEFWEDLCSDYERKSLKRYWEKKRVTQERRKELDQYLREGPSLLANWGKLGRETLKIFGSLDLQSEEIYPLLEPDSLLKTIQYDLLHFQTFQKGKRDDSIKIFLTGSSRLKEIECLREEILRLKISFCDISVLAPDIEPYVPLIEFVFSDIPYRISGFDLAPQSSFRQGLVRLFNLASGRWGAEEVLALFETPAFYRKQGWNEEKLELFRTWITSTHVQWGLDAAHRNHLLADTIGKKSSNRGTWEAGLDRLLDAVVYWKPMQVNADLLEEFLSLFLSLQSRLRPLNEENELPSWADHLEGMAQEFLQADSSDEADGATQNAFHRFLHDLRLCGVKGLFPAPLIQRLLVRPCPGQLHASHLHAVYFAPLDEGALLPIKALFLIGMDEESFPRLKMASSLDLLKRQKVAVPDAAERDRYLFLQALFSAQECLRISYGHLSADEGKPVGPSLLVQEFMSAVALEPIIYSFSPPPVPKKEKSFWPDLSHFPDVSLSEGEVILSLTDLRLLARHPWKFFLQKVHGMYLNESWEDSFALQKGQLLRATLEKPVEEVLADEDLPPGPLGEALKLDIREKAEEWQNQLAEWQLKPFSLIFRENCTEKHWEGSQYVVPPLELHWDRLTVRLVGEIKQATLQGLICANDDSLGGVLKVWPEALALDLALDASKIWLVKSGKSKHLEQIEDHLKAFITYYFRCLNAPSPLLPEWADALLRKGSSELEKKMRKGPRFQDPVLEWVLARTDLPSAEKIVSAWSPYLKETFAGLLALYPTKERAHAPL